MKAKAVAAMAMKRRRAMKKKAAPPQSMKGMKAMKGMKGMKAMRKGMRKGMKKAMEAMAMRKLMKAMKALRFAIPEPHFVIFDGSLRLAYGLPSRLFVWGGIPRADVKAAWSKQALYFKVPMKAMRKK